jgi:hypothetical protein
MVSTAIEVMEQENTGVFQKFGAVYTAVTRG